MLRLGITNIFFATAAVLAACREAAPPPSALDATPAARKALGVAAPFRPDVVAKGEAEELKTSMLARRRRAWHTVAQLLRPVATTVAGASVPAFATWDAREDYERMFHQLYDGLGKEGRHERRSFAPEALGGIESWNARMLDGVPGWTPERYDEFVRGLGTADRQHGLEGLARTLYAPALVRHVLENYKAIDGCIDRIGGLPFSWENPDPANFTACYDREFPAAAAAVKTVWSRADFGFEMPTYATDAAALAARFQRTGGWGAGDGKARPGGDTVYTAELEGGARYRLAGLHVMTKEQREWIWITLWWSPDPDTDFGEDRPDEVRALGGPWSHYKMCVVTAYDDEATDDDVLKARYPSLGAALAATRAVAGSQSWCSNPYVELGDGNDRTNCIGCHQHAGSDFGEREILADHARFPDFGRGRQRASFPTDYLWSFNEEPERFSGYIRNQIEHYDIYDNLGQ